MIIHIIFLFTMLLVIWFNTEAFVEYSHVLKLKLFKVWAEAKWLVIRRLQKNRDFSKCFMLGRFVI